MEKKRTAYFVTYDKEKDWLKLYFVNQSFDEDFEQWDDDEEPRLSYAVQFVHAKETKEAEALYIHFGIVREMSKAAELGFTFIGSR